LKTEYLLNREVDLVLAVLTEKNALIMRTALHTGLRIGDVLSLKTDQLARRFWVTESKTKKRRQVGLPEPLLTDIKNQAGEMWAFENPSTGRAQTRQAVWKDVKRAAHALRLPQNVGPHSARKVYAVELLAKYGDIERVRRALNHSSEAITLIYALADRQLESKKKRRRAKAGRQRV
jgi:integrase